MISINKIFKFISICYFACISYIIFASTDTFAATIDVTPGVSVIADDGQCSLLEAMVGSNFTSSGECPSITDNDTINVPSGTYDLSSAPIVSLDSTGSVNYSRTLNIIGSQDTIFTGENPIINGTETAALNITNTGVSSVSLENIKFAKNSNGKLISIRLTGRGSIKLKNVSVTDATISIPFIQTDLSYLVQLNDVIIDKISTNNDINILDFNFAYRGFNFIAANLNITNSTAKNNYGILGLTSINYIRGEDTGHLYITDSKFDGNTNSIKYINTDSSESPDDGIFKNTSFLNDNGVSFLNNALNVRYENTQFYKNQQALKSPSDCTGQRSSPLQLFYNSTMNENGNLLNEGGAINGCFAVHSFNSSFTNNSGTNSQIYLNMRNGNSIITSLWYGDERYPPENAEISEPQLSIAYFKNSTINDSGIKIDNLNSAIKATINASPTVTAPALELINTTFNTTYPAISINTTVPQELNLYNNIFTSPNNLIDSNAECNLSNIILNEQDNYGTYKCTPNTTVLTATELGISNNPAENGNILPPVGYNGAQQTLTYALLPTSLILEKATTNCPNIDQRNISRTVDGNTTCDVGAFELEALGSQSINVFGDVNTNTIQDTTETNKAGFRVRATQGDITTDYFTDENGLVTIYGLGDYTLDYTQEPNSIYSTYDFTTDLVTQISLVAAQVNEVIDTGIVLSTSSSVSSSTAPVIPASSTPASSTPVSSTPVSSSSFSSIRPITRLTQTGNDNQKWIILSIGVLMLAITGVMVGRRKS